MSPVLILGLMIASCEKIEPQVFPDEAIDFSSSMDDIPLQYGRLVSATSFGQRGNILLPARGQREGNLQLAPASDVPRATASISIRAADSRDSWNRKSPGNRGLSSRLAAVAGRSYRLSERHAFHLDALVEVRGQRVLSKIAG